MPVDTTYLRNDLIGLRRCNERLVIRVDVHDVTLTPEQEAEFWKQVREVAPKNIHIYEDFNSRR